jgi:hypothetical protein
VPAADTAAAIFQNGSGDGTTVTWNLGRLAVIPVRVS